MPFSIFRVVLVQTSASHCLFLAVKTFSDSDHRAFPHIGVAAVHMLLIKVLQAFAVPVKLYSSTKNKSMKGSFYQQYLNVAFLQSAVELSCLSIEMHDADFLLKHVAIQFHLFQEMNLQLPEKQRNHILWKFKLTYTETNVVQVNVIYYSLNRSLTTTTGACISKLYFVSGRWKKLKKLKYLCR